MTARHRAPADRSTNLDALEDGSTDSRRSGGYLAASSTATTPGRVVGLHAKARQRHNRRIRVPSIVQLTQTECGLVAAMMLLRAHGSREPIKRLRSDFEAGRDGLSLQQIRDLLTSRGMESTMFAAGLGGLRRLMDRDRLPVIVYWEEQHFVVLERLTDSRAVIVDPAGGRRRLSLEEFAEGYSERIVTARPGPRFHPVRAREPNPWLAYLRPAMSAWPRVLLLSTLSLLVFVASLVSPSLTRWLIDEQIGTGQVDWSATAVWGLAGFGASLLVLSSARAFVVNALSRHVGRATTHRVFGHLLRLPYRYFSSRSPGELLYRLNSLNAVRDLVSTQLAQGMLDLGMSLVLLAYMVHLSGGLTLVATGFYLVILAVLVLTRRRVSELMDSEMSHTSRAQSLQLESIVGAATVRMSGHEDDVHDAWGEVYEKALSASQRRADVQGLITSCVTTLQVVAPVSVFLVGLREASAGAISVGTVVAFQAVASMFFGLATSVFGCWSQLIQGRSYLSRLADITQEPVMTDNGTREATLRGEIDLTDVSFRYSLQAPDALRDIELSVHPGQRVAIVGASGSGKSTLGKILCGLVEPSTGAVTYDGHPIADYRRKHLYGQLGYVPQEVHLLNRSLHDNIAMGNDDVTEEQVLEALDQVRLGDDVRALPMGLKTLVSDMGANFSGGQKQRLALARALVKRPHVLVLDEATSALDTFNEARITETLRDIACTQVVIAHRLSTVIDADVVHVMDSGTFVQSGTPEELTAVDGPFRQLFAGALPPLSGDDAPAQATGATPEVHNERSTS